MKSVIIVAVLLVLGAVGLSVGAVLLLAGMPWAMICGSVWCLLAAAVLVRGLTNG